MALQALGHKDPYVRLWAVRLLGDDKKVSPNAARTLADMARTEPHVEVRCQLDVDVEPPPADSALRELLLKTERDCFVGASLRAAPRYSWRVNGSLSNPVFFPSGGAVPKKPGLLRAPK